MSLASRSRYYPPFTVMEFGEDHDDFIVQSDFLSQWAGYRYGDQMFDGIDVGMYRGLGISGDYTDKELF